MQKSIRYKFQLKAKLRKASRKFNAIARLAPYMRSPKKCILMNAFFKSQFNYCPYELNRLHERYLRIVYKDKNSHFEDLLERDGSVFTNHQVIRFLAIEMFKVFKGISPQIVNDFSV